MISISSTRATTKRVSETVSHGFAKSCFICARIKPKISTPRDAITKIVVVRYRYLMMTRLRFLM